MLKIVDNRKKDAQDPFGSAGEIGLALDQLPTRYAMTPEDEQLIHEARVCLLAMEISLSLMRDRLEKQ
tara:strand:+ start:598 stop:801 length:204 start_codon:yes stop_codon:yes gene_type:complete